VLSRRRFLKSGALGAPGAIASALGVFRAHNAWAAAKPARLGPGPYRPLRVVADESRRAILALPEGFELVTFAVTGAPMAGGVERHARNADGMGAFAAPSGIVRLIRNQELRNPPGDFTLGVGGDARARYDASAMAGTTTIDYEPAQRRVVREFFSLNGTMVNCAGGLAYRNAGWLTCEETTAGPKDGWQKKHGYVFLVPASADEVVPAEALPALGRFAHEAALAHPTTGIVYETEDAGSNSGFYRFVPKDPARLSSGGALQMLKVPIRNWKRASPRALRRVTHEAVRASFDSKGFSRDTTARFISFRRAAAMRKAAIPSGKVSGRVTGSSGVTCPSPKAGGSRSYTNRQTARCWTPPTT
jgi:secreted PhoX family phosphatase